MPTEGTAVARLIAVPVAVALLALLWLIPNVENLSFSRLSTEIDYNYPVYATADDRDNLYVVDTSRRRVTRRTPDGRVNLELRGGQRERGEFFYAEEITVDANGNLYLLNLVTDLDGYYVKREEILRFDPGGRMTGVIERREYGDPEDQVPALVQRGRIQSLHTKGADVGWFVADDQGITPYRHEGGETREGSRYEWEGADRHVADIAPYRGERDGFVYSDKNGRVVHVGGTSNERLLYEAPQNKLDIVPWDVESYPDGRVAFVDLEHRAIRQIGTSPGRPGIILDRSLIEAADHTTDTYNYYRQDIPQSGTLVTTNDEAVVSLDMTTGAIDYVTGGARPVERTIAIGLTWFAAAVACIAILLAAYRFYVHVFDRQLPPLLVKSLAIVLVVGMSATIVASIIIPNLTERSEDILLGKIGSMQDTIPNTVDGELFHKINGLSDYNSPAYREIRTQFLDALSHNRDPWNENFYFALYRLIDGRLYGFMFLNGEIGMYHPYDWIGYGNPYDQALDGDIAMKSVTSLAGDWIYGVSPIRDDHGRIVALFETGTDLYTFNQSTRLLIEEIIYEVITMLVILIILVIELAVFNDRRRQRHASLRMHPPTERGRPPDMTIPPVSGYSDAMLVRIPAFLLFSAVMLSLSYLPLLAQDFYTPIAGLSEEMVIALPLSAQMFFFGIGTIAAGSIGSHFGWRAAFNSGLVGVVIGLVASGLARDITMLIIARALVGLGTGMAFIGLRLLINREAEREARSQGFRHLYAGVSAGIIAGVVLGGTLANYLGYGPTFFVGTALIAAAMGFYFLNLRSTPVMRPRTGNTTSQSIRLRDLGRFFSSRQVWGFMLLLLVPTYIAGTFVAYYFPLFAKSQGLASDDIGRWIVVNGLFIIYLGPPLAGMLQNAMGATRTAAVGSVLWGIALLIFALTGSLIGAIATLIVMGIAEGFCAPAQNDAYLELDACGHIGEDRAVGYLGLFGKLGETIGPIAFAGALLLGATTGPLVLGIGVALLAMPYFLTRSRDKALTGINST